MVNFFIDRPIFSWVIAIVIMLAGGLSILSLPIAQYPAPRRRPFRAPSSKSSNNSSAVWTI